MNHVPPNGRPVAPMSCRVAGLRGHERSVGERLAEERAHLLPIPQGATPCQAKPQTASSLCLVRFDTNDYSVPCAYAHHPVTVQADAQAGQPIGSGAMESTCRQSQCRFKRPGQFWSQTGDVALLTLETLWRKGRWNLLFPHAGKINPQNN